MGPNAVNGSGERKSGTEHKALPVVGLTVPENLAGFIYTGGSEMVLIPSVMVH